MLSRMDEFKYYIILFISSGSVVKCQMLWLWDSPAWWACFMININIRIITNFRMALLCHEMTTDDITLILVIQCTSRYFFGVEYLSRVCL